MASDTADETNSGFMNLWRDLQYENDGVRLGQRLQSFSQKSSLNTILDFADHLFDQTDVLRAVLHRHSCLSAHFLAAVLAVPPPPKLALVPLASETEQHIYHWSQVNLAKRTPSYPYAREGHDPISFISKFVNTLLAWHCQSSHSSLEFVTYIDMMHIMMFIIVIHLVSGDIEINPGPRDLLNLKKPKVRDLHRIFTQSGVSHDYITIGVELDVQWRDLNVNNPALTGTNLCLVFDRWIQKNKDVTWKRILRLCKDCQYGKVESEINVFLSSDEAHTEYGMEPDFECSENMTIPKSSNDNKYSNKTVYGLLITIIILLLIIIIVLCYLVARPNQPTVITMGNGLASKTMINECQTLIDCNELDKLCA
ncbi:PREDICTED: uncharacterized protein LOC109591615 [Amphimedon queenslandica]|uniref:Death domain-containing protein n=1 Tax=Amphimedon queenslandica TaxID=400682 RepID=A0A1X7VLD4_AMPQE|nr:PREDICTED: uncharacterized protein LOC109591615 [Amphimedon queenslandica]|eukprot:XP_019862879.1 PREDICTED: uncharacterized protein LOC109591615 [Amphimedon queenslandica]